MPSLSELQRHLHELFRGEQSVARTAKALGCDAERLAIYADFVRNHVRSSLDKNYPYLQRMMSAELWDELREVYFETCPSREWEVNRASEGFAEFLERERGHRAALHPAHVVMAQLEWEQFVTYMHRERVPSPAEVEKLTLNPTLSVLEMPFDLLELIAEHGEDAEVALPIPEPEETIALIYRDPRDYDARVERATPELLFAFKMAAEGIDVASAAAASGESEARIGAIIADAAERGLVIVPRRPTPP